jgi:hypothetical protein
VSTLPASPQAKAGRLLEWSLSSALATQRDPINKIKYRYPNIKLNERQEKKIKIEAFFKN